MANDGELGSYSVELDIPSGDLDVAAYINNLFPDEESLAAGLDPFLNQLRSTVAMIDSELVELVRNQQNRGSECDQKVTLSLESIESFAESVRDMSVAASQAEQMARDALSPARPYSLAVANTGASLAAVDALIALNDGVILLEEAVRSSSLEKIGSDLALFSRINDALHQLEGIDVDQDSPDRKPSRVSELRQRAKRAQDMLRQAIMSEFRLLSDIVTLSITNNAPDPEKLDDATSRLQTACSIASAAGNGVQGEVIGFHVRGRLLSFRAAFEMDKSGISGIEKRFAWVRRELRSNWARLGGESNDCAWAVVFPGEWDVPWRLADAFFREMRTWVSDLLKAGADRDVIAMVGALSSSKEFEVELDKRFERLKPQNTNPGDSENRGVTEDKGFAGSLSSCFGPFMGSYVSQEDDHLKAIFIDLLRAETWTCSDGDVLRSSTDLFLAVKKSVRMCASLDTGQPFYSLFKVFQKHLGAYSTELVRRIPAGNSRTLDGKTASNGNDGTTGNAKQSADTMTAPEFAKRIEIACSIIATAEYCAITVEQLEVSLREIVKPAYKEDISMNTERERFASASARAVRALAALVSSDLMLTLGTISRENWAEWTAVGDSSPYVEEFGRKLSYIMPLLGSKLSKPHLRFFIERFAAALVPEYSRLLHGCPLMNHTGAQQLLLDASALKGYLKNVPALAHAPVPATFAKYVAREMSSIESMLKIVLTPVEASVNAYITLLPDGSAADLQHILEMKGLRRADAAPLILEYTRRVGPNRGLKPRNGLGEQETLDLQSSSADTMERLDVVEAEKRVSAVLNAGSTPAEVGVESMRALFRGLGNWSGSFKDAKLADRLGQTADRINESLESTAEQVKRRFTSS